MQTLCLLFRCTCLCYALFIFRLLGKPYDLTNIYLQLALGISPPHDECQNTAKVQPSNLPRQILSSLPGVTVQHIQQLDIEMQENASSRTKSKQTMKAFLENALRSNMNDNMKKQQTIQNLPEKLLIHSRKLSTETADVFDFGFVFDFNDSS